MAAPLVRGRKTGQTPWRCFALPAYLLCVQEDEPAVAELLQPGQKALLLVGGRGGRGNHSFKTRLDTAPAIAEKGEAGVEEWLDLELKVRAGTDRGQVWGRRGGGNWAVVRFGGGDCTAHLQDGVSHGQGFHPCSRPSLCTEGLKNDGGH